MSSKYKVGEDAIPHFVTFTVVGWIDIFSREIYKEKLLESLRFCIKEKGLTVHTWIIMTNHVHLIIRSNRNKIADIVRDIKKYTSRQIIDIIVQNSKESRKEWMLNIFSFVGKGNNNNKNYQFWQQDYHPVELSTNEKLAQRLVYLHENPVRSGLVWETWHYKYSSAIDYCTTEKGLLQIEHI
jgi:putative transposase